MMPEGGASPALADRLIDRLDALIPPFPAWAFAFRIWSAMALALYAAFWLQLDSASSAATCVAILAQPKRGQAISKAIFRVVGTLVGIVVSIVVMGLFGQDRVLLLVSVAVWLGVCVFVAQALQDTRAYGAVLSGYTVAIIALGAINTPQDTFDTAVARLAAITVGIVVITFINDALGSPNAWRDLLPRLADTAVDVRAYARDALTRGDPGLERAAALTARLVPMGPDAHAVETEFDHGGDRAAGARSCIGALYTMLAASRVIARAAAGLPARGPAVEEALAICRRALDGAEGAAFERDDARLRDLVDAAIRDPAPCSEPCPVAVQSVPTLSSCRSALPSAGPAATSAGSTLDEIVLLQRALDLVCAARFSEDGLRALADGSTPLRDVALPKHREFALALRNAVRVVIAFGLGAGLLVAGGLPQGAVALVQLGALGGLSGTTPDPRAFAQGALRGMVIAAVCAGVVRFAVLQETAGYPLLALAMAPPVFLGCFLSLQPKTFGLGFILLVYFPVLLGPANPQSYDILTFLLECLFSVLSAAILAAIVPAVLPTSDAQKRAFALDSARRSLADALVGMGGNATARTALNADRLTQFAGYGSGSGSVRRMALAHAAALARLEAAAARAHDEIRLLRPVGAFEPDLAAARAALAAGDPARLEGAADALVRRAAGEPRAVRMSVARLVSDLITAARVVDGNRRFLRRLAIAPF